MKDSQPKKPEKNSGNKYIKADNERFSTYDIYEDVHK